MSFADLRSSRKAKESKSFVMDLAKSSSDSSVSFASQDPEHAGHGVMANNHGRAVVVPDLSSQVGLPSALNIRTSSINGRGIYAGENFVPGAALVLSFATCRT
jgi:hypothetical protein